MLSPAASRQQVVTLEQTPSIAFMVRILLSSAQFRLLMSYVLTSANDQTRQCCRLLSSKHVNVVMLRLNNLQWLS